MHDLNKVPYAEWLEKALTSIIDMPVDSICILTKFKDGGVSSTCYNASMLDKITLSGYLQQEAMMDQLFNNGFIVAVEEDDEEFDEED